MASGITSTFSVSRAEQATPEISFTYNHLTVGSGDKVSVTKWIECYYAGISQDARHTSSGFERDKSTGPG